MISLGTCNRFNLVSRVSPFHVPKGETLGTSLQRLNFNTVSFCYLSSISFEIHFVALIVDFVPNTSDEEGRYSYKNQPSVGFFNLEKLLNALRALLEDYGE